MPAGNVPPNPAELLVSNKMMNLLEEFKRQFDVIIFDTPPTLLVTDACALSRIVDSTMIVAAYGKTKKDDLQRVKKAIENVGGKVAGVVMNQVPMSESKYEGAYYYGSVMDKDKSKPTENNNNNINKTDKIKDEYRSAERHNIFIEESNNSIKNNISSFESNVSKYKEEPIRKMESSTKNIIEEKNKNEEKNETFNASKDVTDNIPKSNIQNNIQKGSDSTITIDRTQDILKQVNDYLDMEKKKLNNGGY